MIDRFTIEVVHKAPVSMTLLVDGFTLIVAATERAVLYRLAA